ncbi:MAG: OsmC domain/YcaO domain-containing protein [Proteobacteria bacterium]|nr:OsmC domain/YcaO domain-containing protein [Pseudomonadota bacterium]
MQINVRFLENLRLEAAFDDFKVIADQPIRYKGDGTAPGPFDYFLASSALCAAYFVKIYCVARNIATDDIRVTQDNIVDPDNRYNQTFNIEIELPEGISEKDREGMISAMDRCTVKRVIQNTPTFKITPKSVLGSENKLILQGIANFDERTRIPGKDSSLEETLLRMTAMIEGLGIKLEVASWRNPVPHVWSVHIRDADSPMCFTNGKGATKAAALCSALGEYLERLSTNYFYSDFYLPVDGEFVHYPQERWFESSDDSLPMDLMDDHLKEIYGNQGELKLSNLIDTNSNRRGVCALPFVRQSDQKTVYIPVNLIANIFVSNGMSAGNTIMEARVQALSEIFERAVKNQIISEELTLPDVPRSVLERYPKIMEGIQKLEEQGFPVFVNAASLGGGFPLMNVTLMNPRNGGVFASFGAHPNFEVALERTLTELLQGRSFEGLNDLLPPTLNELAVKEHNNIIDHFIDSTGVVSWKFFKETADYDFVDWSFKGSTQEEFDYLMGLLREIEKEVYISDYTELGACATRILVPEYSEIYLPEELVWDNHNKSRLFRDDILNLHTLSDELLQDLVTRLEESEIDNYHTIAELTGVAFDENSIWGQLTIGELKALSYLKLQAVEEAKVYVEMLSTFSNSLPERKKFYQLLNVLVDIELDESLEQTDLATALIKMYGPSLYQAALGSIQGTVSFYGLTPTDSKLTGLDKHQRLLASYQKLMRARRG